MSLRNITKFACFVISVLLTANCTNISYGGAEHAEIGSSNGGFEKAEVIARITSKEINESSGLVVSKCQPDVFWTHNDSGDGPFVYAFNIKGEPRGTFRVPNSKNTDWEDIATTRATSGECFLYIGEIGDNDRKRDVHTVYKLKEPIVSNLTALATRESASQTGEAEVLNFRYPNQRLDAEALLVHPNTNEIYLVSKEFDGPAKVFKLKPEFSSQEIQTAVEVAEITLPANPKGFITGGDISPDGKHVALCDYFAGYEFVLPHTAANFDDVWHVKPVAFDLGPRQIGEAITFGVDADSVFATTEKPNAPLIQVRRSQK